MRMFREDFAAGVRSLVEGGSPAGFDPALKEAYFEKMVAVRQPAGSAVHRRPGPLGHGRGAARDEAADHRVRHP
jgi:hypothetical protein